MIFSRTLKQVLGGTKTQTRRLCYLADSLGFVTDDGVKRKAVLDNSHPSRARTRWAVGRTYAVQPERCHAARGRIEVIDLRREEDPTQISEADARAEGFADRAAFLASWTVLHRKKPVQPVWVITFRLVARLKARRP